MALALAAILKKRVLPDTMAPWIPTVCMISHGGNLAGYPHTAFARAQGAERVLLQVDTGA